jgi:hypothetical protein
MKLALKISSLLFITFWLTGCVDEPLQRVNVSGILYSGWANRYYYISAGSLPIARADAYSGYFELYVTSKPFKLVVEEKWQESIQNAFIYDNITISNLHPVCMEWTNFAKYYNRLRLKSTIPSLMKRN